MTALERRVLLVVPCYNEANRLDAGAFARFAATHNGYGILFVDDGSRDATLELLQRLASSHPQAFAVLPLPRNVGKAEAVRQGVLAAAAAGPEYIGYWDADLATPLDIAPEFVRLLDEQPHLDLVTGARVQLLGRSIRRRAARHYTGRVFATAVSLLLRMAVYDTQCGAKLFRWAPAMRSAFADPFLSRWVFDVEIIARMKAFRQSKGLAPAAGAIYEFPLPRWHDVAGSKLRPSDYVRAARDLARIWRRYPLARAGGIAPLPAAVCPAPDAARVAEGNSGGRPAPSR